MEIGIDSFASFARENDGSKRLSAADALGLLLQRIQFADEMGLDIFGIGEHHREEFPDSAPPVSLAQLPMT